LRAIVLGEERAVYQLLPLRMHLVSLSNIRKENFSRSSVAQSLMSELNSGSYFSVANFMYQEGVMADEKSTNQNQENNQDQEKAMGAAANASTQPQGSDDARSETAGQGGGIQGTGQGQQNPGGYSGGNEQSRDESRSNQGSDRRPDPTQGE